MPQPNFKIEIHPFAGHKIAYLKKKVFNLFWITMDDQLQITERDFEVVEWWMNRYGLSVEHVKQLAAA